MINRGMGIMARAVSFRLVAAMMARVAPPSRIISTNTINPKPNAILIWLMSLTACAMISPVLTLSRYAMSRLKTRLKRSSLIFFSTFLALPMRRLRHPYLKPAMARPRRRIKRHWKKSVLLSKDSVVRLSIIVFIIWGTIICAASTIIMHKIPRSILFRFFLKYG